MPHRSTRPRLRGRGLIMAALLALAAAWLAPLSPASAEEIDTFEELLARAPLGPYDGRYKGELKFSERSCGTSVLEFGIVDSKLYHPKLRDAGYQDIQSLRGRVDEVGQIKGIVTIGPYNFPFVGELKDGEVKGAVYARTVSCNGVKYDADIFWSATLVKARVSQEAKREEAADPAPIEPPKKKEPGASAKKSKPADGAAPVIEAPDTLEAKASSITIEGTARDASAIVEFTVDGKPVTLGQDGRFSVKRGVPQGESEIRLAATDEWGNTAERVITVRREAKTAAAPKPSEPVKTVPTVTAVEELDELSQTLGNFVALIIGNDKYKHLPALKTAAADADALAELLKRRYGFKTTVLKNATRRDVLAALSSLRSSLRFDDNLVIYYAGHGYLDEVTERGYWLPVDAEADNPANWISNADVTDMLKALPSRAVLVIADSCYAGTLTRAIVPPAVGGADRRAFLERVAAKRARTVLASGGLEPVADSGGGKHSVFSKALLDILSENETVIDAQSLFAPIRQRVVLNAEQTPEYSDVRLAGHEGGEFIFVPR